MGRPVTRQAAFAAVALYATGGWISGALMGAEWLRTVNRSGFPNWAMLLPSLGLVCAAAALHQSSAVQDQTGVFLGRIAWSSVLGAALWSRVGWAGRFGPGFTALSDWILAGSLVAVGALVVVSVVRVGRASGQPLVRAITMGIAVTASSVAAFSTWDLLSPIIALPKGVALLVGCATLIGVPLAALSAAFLLPQHRRPTS